MLFLSLGVTVLFYGTLIHAYFYNPLASESYLEVEKCPACFGKEHCRDFLKSDYKFASFISSRFFRFVNVKNVYKGEYNGMNVVVKKLAQNSEITKIDREICKSLGGASSCDVSDAIFSYNAQGWWKQKLVPQPNSRTFGHDCLPDGETSQSHHGQIRGEN